MGFKLHFYIAESCTCSGLSPSFNRYNRSIKHDKASEERDKELNKRLPGDMVKDSPIPGLRDLLGAECHGECLVVDQYSFTMFKESAKLDGTICSFFLHAVINCYHVLYPYIPIYLYLLGKQKKIR